MPPSLRLVLSLLYLVAACDASGETLSGKEPPSGGPSGDDAGKQGAAHRADAGARDASKPRTGSPVDAAGPRADAGSSDGAAAHDAGSASASGDASAGGAVAVDEAASAGAIAALTEHLGSSAPRPALDQQSFASVPLTRADAERAKKLLWDDLARSIKQDRKDEVGATETAARTIPGPGGKSLRYYLARRGETPAGGRSLFISMHGGGSAPSATNDSQWKNQIALVDSYKPVDAVWVAPRAPIDDWNMWFVEGIDIMFERLITDMIVFEGIDPNKVYINGYSAGGDGVYQLGPRMAERWAGAGMSAGHPNSASPLNLRNVPFAVHVGGDDTAFDRNKKGEEWGKQLEALAKQDPGGYVNQWQVHAGLPHWMNMEDAVSIPFLQSQTRKPYPSKVVWRQAELTRAHFYWLAVDQKDQKFASEVRASYTGQEVAVSGVKDLAHLTVRLADEMLDMDLPIRISHDAKTVFAERVARTIGVLARTLNECNDPTMMFSGEVSVSLE